MKDLQSLLEKAIIIATNAHRGQVDKGGYAYILHPLRVMMKCEKIEEKIVAILHDVIEDTEITLEDLRKEGFPSNILDGIDGVTRKDDETYFQFIERAKLNKLSRIVKLHDLEDNMDISRIPEPTAKDFSRLKRYKKARKLLIDFIVEEERM